MPNYGMNDQPGRGLGLGRGMGRGRGWGMRRNANSTNNEECPRFPWLPRFWRHQADDINQPSDASKEEEIQILESRLAELKK